MPDARECARLLGALESATGIDPTLRRDLQAFLGECQRGFSEPAATLSALPEEQPWTAVFGEMLELAADETVIHDRISMFPDSAVNGTLAVVAVQFFVEFWAEPGQSWRERDAGRAATFGERLGAFMQHALGLFPFSPGTYQEFPDGWMQRVGGRGMVTGRVRRVLRPGLQDSQNQLRVPAVVEVE
jgi:hypothetical protein